VINFKRNVVYNKKVMNYYHHEGLSVGIILTLGFNRLGSLPYLGGDSGRRCSCVDD
jgi:hypothetical protein